MQRRSGRVDTYAGKRPARIVRVGGALLTALFACGCAPPAETLSETYDGAGLPANDCFDPERGEFDISCLTDAEIAALLEDLDNDGLNNLEELRLGLDPYDASDGPDIDGDGIPNGEDEDTDGDGVPNRHDYDVDGDRIFNDHDIDIDADGLIGKDDPDDDGDLLSDRFDLDDDGDGTPDDEDDDDEDDEPSGRLDDLVERLRDGMLEEADKNAIAREISDRLASTADRGSLQFVLTDVVAEALSEQRQQLDESIPPGIAAVDAVYAQLADSLAYVKQQQDNPKAPLDDKQLGDVARDFLPRARAVSQLARTFQTLPISDLSAVVSDLRAAAGPLRFPEVAEELSNIVNPDARGTPEDEREELALLTNGVTKLARAFPDALGGDLVNALDQIRDLVGDDIDVESPEIDRLLERMEELAGEDPPRDLFEAVDELTDEEDDSEEAEDEDASDSEGGFAWIDFGPPPMDAAVQCVTVSPDSKKTGRHGRLVRSCFSALAGKLPVVPERDYWNMG